MEKLNFVEMPKKPELSDVDQALRESIGASIRAASVRGNCKPGDIAAAGGVSLAHQYRIESGERTADVLYVVKVARHLGISVDELISGHASNGNQSQEGSRKGAVQIGGDATGSPINTGKGSSVQVKQEKSLFSVAIGSISKK